VSRLKVPKQVQKKTIDLQIDFKPSPTQTEVGGIVKTKKRGHLVSQKLDRFHVQIPIGRTAQVIFTELDSENQIGSLDFCVTHDGDKPRASPSV